MAGVLVILLILVGLPLLAWWLGGRSFWSRLKPGAEHDLYRTLVRRHGLRPGEVVQVQRAISRGRALDEPRLRAAVVDWGRAIQRGTEERRRRNTAARRVGVALLFLWAVFLVGAAVTALIEQRWGDLLRGLLWLALLALPEAISARNLRRAIELNRDPPAG